MEEEIDIKELLLALWRRKIIIIIVTCLFFVIGVCLYGRTIIKKTDSKIVANEEELKENVDNCYVETDFMLSRGTNKELDGVTSTYKLTIDAGVITNLNRFATSTSFLQNALNQLSLVPKIDINDIKDNIIVFRNETSDIITLVVVNEDEEVAAKISNAILIELTNKISKLYGIEELIIIDGPKRLEQEEIEELEDRTKNNNLHEEDEKEKTDSETKPSGSKKKVVLVTAAGFVLACGVIIVIELLDDSVRNEKQLESVTHIKTLVRVPNTNSDVSDKIEILRVSLESYHTILVTSPEKQDGKSFVAKNLAKSFAKLGKKTLLIDAKALLNDNIEEISESSDKNLSILVSSKDNRSATVLSELDIENRVNRLKEIYEIVIIDSESALEDGNTLAVAKTIKDVIIVTSERKTKVENVVRTKKYIENINGNIIGNVLNKSIEK